MHFKSIISKEIQRPGVTHVFEVNLIPFNFSTQMAALMPGFR